MRISDWSSDVCSSDLETSCCFSLKRADGDDTKHPRVHVEQQMAVKRPVTRSIGSQVEADLAAGQHINGVLARIAAGVAVHHLEKMAMQMDWMGHHRIVRSEEHTSELQSLMRISYA